MENEEIKNVSDLIDNRNSNIPKDFDFDKFQVDRFNNSKVESKIYNCEICHNKGTIAYLNSNHKMAYKKCKCYDIRKNRERMKEIGLLDFISSNYAIENIEPKEEWEKKVFEIANDYINNSEKDSFFYGGAVGGGKTTICANLMAKKIMQNENAMADYIVWDISYKDLEFAENGRDRLEQLKNVDILFIDDLFRSARVKPINEVEREKAKAIIDYRYRNKLITIISSELYLSEIEEFDEAIGSRIYEMCGKGRYIVNCKRDKERNHRKDKEKIEDNKMTSLLDE